VTPAQVLWFSWDQVTRLDWLYWHAELTLRTVSPDNKMTLELLERFLQERALKRLTNKGS
jgi:hypothetical protein